MAFSEGIPLKVDLVLLQNALVDFKTLEGTSLVLKNLLCASITRQEHTDH